MHSRRATVRVLLLIVAGAAAAPPVTACISPSEEAATEPAAGDVVLRRGSGIWSGVFARLNHRDDRFSHAGVVVSGRGGLKVVHAEADDDGANGQVRLDPFGDFTAESPHVVLLRLGDRGAAMRLENAALAMHAAALPFDLDFDLTDGAAVYCTELVWRSLAIALERDPLPDKPIVAGRRAVLIENFLLDMPDLHVVERWNSGGNR